MNSPLRIALVGDYNPDVVAHKAIPLAIDDAYAPTQEEVDYAERVIAAAEEGERSGLGVISLNGKMIDAPIINHARVVIERKNASGIRQ